MVIQAIINLALTIATFLIGLLPTADSVTLSNITNYASGFKNILIGANYIFPVDTLLTFLGIILVCESVVFGFKTYRWLATIISGGIVKAH